MEQLSFFSAEASGPRIDDLAGVLCGHGRLVSFGRTAARLSVLVGDRWRARVLLGEFALRGVRAEVVTGEDGGLLVRTAFRADLLPMSVAWECAGGSRGPGASEKAVPPGFHLDGAVLRLWALASGWRAEKGYVLPLDEEAPETHEPLAAALRGSGLGGKTLGPRAGGPAIRVSGRRRLATLGELVGKAPPEAELAWPEEIPARRAEAS
ncbi:hypothetical protein [Amycolatopsis sp. CA-230715]|uniref:hypothetical protein n=1 Tax=Amycolatopsis sp. CA-230715 TaxID=2745196 RepID=UPI001C037C48|nr:hypothetical protein [Amycolatopsis sp. CA-230715]QWF81412.1 hypothetical protein HUW46_04843 [Amycolatopsis sp. CA-230715]